jgi:hypothetical protein
VQIAEGLDRSSLWKHFWLPAHLRSKLHAIQMPYMQTNIIPSHDRSLFDGVMSAGISKSVGFPR